MTTKPKPEIGNYLRVFARLVLAFLIGLILKNSGYIQKGTIQYYLFVPLAAAVVWIIMHVPLASRRR